MNVELDEFILKNTQAKSIIREELIQSLWSGYGQLFRVYLEGPMKQVIVKNINYPKVDNHPRGQGGSFAHQRKVNSYKVECNWYLNYAPHWSKKLDFPNYIAHQDNENGFFLMMEDLAVDGFNGNAMVSPTRIENVIKWLGRFHGKLMFSETDGLWSKGTYWHLDTRPKELEQMPKNALYSNAKLIDKVLSQAKYQTIVHGDAKWMNFCFNDYDEVRAVDFQYIGGGVGIKDVVYFLGSVFDETDLYKRADEMLDLYFTTLNYSLGTNFSTELEEEYRKLYPICWADFERFMLGWMPTHHKLNGYSKEQSLKALNLLHEF